MKFINLIQMPNGFLAPSLPFRTADEAQRHARGPNCVGTMRITDAVADALLRDGTVAEYEAGGLS